MVDGLIMDYQLTVPSLMRRAEQLYGSREVVSRLPDKSLHRYRMADFVRRSKQLTLALRRLGIRSGDRVATLAWNHYGHLEAYFGVPSAEAVLHTINLRLPVDDIVYIADHAEDRILLIDEVLLPLFQQIRSRTHFEHVVVMQATKPVPDGMLDYEELLAAEDPAAFAYPEFGERTAAAMSYTSGTTGRPKGVLYSHRAIVLHSLGIGLAESVALSGHDVAMPVVPMFHVNAWGLPFACVMIGAKLVLPGPHLDPQSLIDLLVRERVTFTAGVPTIWLGILQALDKAAERPDLSALHTMLVGGAAAPPAMIAGFEQRHGLRVVHAWGMTETTPLGTVSNLPLELEGASPEEQLRSRSRQGIPMPLVEVRARGENGSVPWDGKTPGELELRGAWVASSYYRSDEQADRFTEDGWFRTGDIVTIDPTGSVQIQDRIKDVIKSGGEWISSVLLENALMAHPAVAEAAVIAVPDPKWQERPLACVVLREGQSATPDELREFLARDFPKWWLPDAFAFLDQIPKTSAGKFLKSALRKQFATEKEL